MCVYFTVCEVDWFSVQYVCGATGVMSFSTRIALYNILVTDEIDGNVSRAIEANLN